eukprot:g82787.t1
MKSYKGDWANSDEWGEDVKAAIKDLRDTILKDPLVEDGTVLRASAHCHYPPFIRIIRCVHAHNPGVIRMSRELLQEGSSVYSIQQG